MEFINAKKVFGSSLLKLRKCFVFVTQGSITRTPYLIEVYNSVIHVLSEESGEEFAVKNQETEGEAAEELNLEEEEARVYKGYNGGKHKEIFLNESRILYREQTKLGF